MANTQSNTIEASKSWRVLECNPRWGRGLDQPATGRDVHIDINGKWGDAGKDAALMAAAQDLLEALEEIAKLATWCLDTQPDKLVALQSHLRETKQQARAAIEAANGS